VKDVLFDLPWMGRWQIVQAGEVFDALADPTRRNVLETLAKRGGATATELAADMPVTRQAVAKHLSHLSRKGMVEPHRRGRETRYVLLPESLAHAIDWLGGVARAGKRRRPS
jgi:DNA-binding transcriptional ArsR family regulator